MTGAAPAEIPDPAPRRVFLAPGTLYCTAEPVLISTILGSCIAICLWDRHRRIGGMNHYVLPHGTEGDGGARYGDVAVARLVERMIGLGGAIEDLRAKVFGGATVLSFGSAAETVGHRNLEVALDRLHAYRIPIVARRTGGESGLFIRLDTASGEVMLRELRAGDPPG